VQGTGGAVSRRVHSGKRGGEWDRIMNKKEQVALGSVVASAALTIGKGIVGLSTGSLAILSEAAHSLIDLAATLMTYYAVRIAAKPADAEHHYGHGKVENLSALAETALLFVLSGIVAWEASQRLFGGTGHAVEATPAAFVVILASIAIDFSRARLLSRTAKETASEALAADALHFSSDMASSAAVLVGLVGLRSGFAWADSAAALAVALFVCVAGWRLGRRTIDTLTDAAPEGVAERISTIARQVRNVVSVERVRARGVGATVFGEIEVGASRTLPLDRVAMLKSEIDAAVIKALPGAQISVSVVPRALERETVMERVMVIARNRGLAVHHVTVQAIGDRLSISLDLEVDGELSLLAAHDIADGLETAIRDEFGPAVEVETHIEPMQMTGLAGRDAPAMHTAAIETALSELACASGLLRNVHEVRVRDTSEGEVVNFHCDVDPQKTVATVHELVDGVERGLRRRFPAVRRVIGHAEPRE
jgi:cation diffusion facilitator family transporter